MRFFWIQYRADVPLVLSDPLHFGEIRYGRAFAHGVAVLNLSRTVGPWVPRQEDKERQQ